MTIYLEDCTINTANSSPANSPDRALAVEDDIATLDLLMQRMVNESGEPSGFEARSWLGHWLMGMVLALDDRGLLDVLNEPVAWSW